MDYMKWLLAAGQVKPSPRQLRFMKDPFYAFVHFGPNTYTGREWGDGQEDEAVFNPTGLDCDQWVEAVKSAGMTGLVLTAKHHDGFCLWQTDTTAHSVKNSPWRGGRGDVVMEAARACERGHIRFGVYLSPWDRNSPLYGTGAYNDLYRAQLTELLTRYGELFYVWFDGACGEGPNGKKQSYDFDSYIELIRKYQPGACIFNDAGPDIRWVGNEAGQARNAEWMVVPGELCYRAEKQTDQSLLGGELHGIYNTWPRLGEMDVIAHSAGLAFCPAETDMSIRPGWFYHPEEEPHSLRRLFDTYVTSVGGSAAFNLNIPPMPSGRFDSRDVQRLGELGRALRDAFSDDLARDACVTCQVGDTQAIYNVMFPRERTIRYVDLREDIQNGQRVEGFIVEDPNGDPRFPLYQGVTVGSRRICDLGEKKTLSQLTIRVLSSRGPVDGLLIRAY